MEYQVIRSGRKTLALQVKNGQLIVRAPLKTRDADIKKFVLNNTVWIEKQLKKAELRAERTAGVTPLTPEELKALAQRAAQVIPERVSHYAAIMGVKYNRITTRAQRTRWGSCSSKGNLNFNCLLMLSPTEVIDSVVVHELCHLKQMNHSPRFYELLLSVFPEYYKWHDWLKQNGDVLLARLPSKN